MSPRTGFNIPRSPLGSAWSSQPWSHSLCLTRSSPYLFPRQGETATIEQTVPAPCCPSRPGVPCLPSGPALALPPHTPAQPAATPQGVQGSSSPRADKQPLHRIVSMPAFAPTAAPGHEQHRQDEAGTHGLHWCSGVIPQGASAHCKPICTWTILPLHHSRQTEKTQPETWAEKGRSKVWWHRGLALPAPTSHSLPASTDKQLLLEIMPSSPEHWELCVQEQLLPRC